MSTDSPTTADPVRPLPALLAAVGCAGLLGLSIIPPSSTRIEAWPWAAFAALGWLLPIGVALVRFALNRPAARFGGWIDAGLGLLALAVTASALSSPLRGVALPHLLPVLGACALPFALLPLFQPEAAARTWRLGGAIIGIILISSLVLWVEPWNGLSLARLGVRNEQPFGHVNTTGSVAVLAATWLAVGAVRETGRGRILFALGALAAIMTAASSGSRGAVLALAAAGLTAAALVWLRRGRLLLFVGCVTVLAAGAVASNSRLRELVLHGRWSATVQESNDQRTAMLTGGIQLGMARPLFGWGPGTIPHVFPRVRAALPGSADNVVHLHNTPLQLWVTSGTVGLTAGLLIIVGLAGRLRRSSWTPERIALASGLAATGTVLIFDHPFATPVFAVLAAAHLAAWITPAPPIKRTRFVLWAGAPVVVLSLVFSVRDLAARSAYASALDLASAGDAVGFAASLRRAIALAPSDPYYAHLLAAHLATGYLLGLPHPDSPQTAAALLSDSLVANPNLEYAHYNLGWLLLDSDPVSASAHFRAAAFLAPQRGAVYYGLGLARIRMNDTRGAVRAFATEWLLNPAFAWSPIWHRPPLDAMRPEILTLASAEAHTHGINPWAELNAPGVEGAPYRRLRTGYGVLMGHPDGPPPVDINIQFSVVLPPVIKNRVPEHGWLSGQALLDFLETD